MPFPKGLFDYSSFQLHASSSVGAILVIAQWGRGAGRIQDSPLHSISGLTQVKFAINNHLEQDHRGIKQRTRPMGGFKNVDSAKHFCRVHDEVRNFLRPRSCRNEVVSLAQRRLLYTARTRVLLTSLAAA